MVVTTEGVNFYLTFRERRYSIYTQVIPPPPPTGCQQMYFTFIDEQFQKANPNCILKGNNFKCTETLPLSQKGYALCWVGNIFQFNSDFYLTFSKFQRTFYKNRENFLLIQEKHAKSSEVGSAGQRYEYLEKQLIIPKQN